MPTPTVRHTIWIPRWHPTPLNQLLGNVHKAGRLKRADRDMIAAHVHLCRTPKASGKRRVHLEIVLGRGQRKHDPDAWWKSLLDSLVKAKALINDTDRWVVCDPVAYSRDDNWGSRVTLTDVATEREVAS